ncbi:MmcQ/YjbR family DNA-binding protein [Actinomadura soli]|uniref:MmcQ/YjbR family DNA-binding protein n=1 Tax=Actinomadura soli TaxID=2508997 RepID=A0A5C4JD96_9ACTN|nr:MmcQ/YjbR family DNA-binding protein [Actinomadura soli]TMR02166.1 MmcQ/YjbR family DNA-binding protein [Actinomadura soli]
MTPEELFWDLVEPTLTDPAVTRSTMMGLPCVRHHGRLFAALDTRNQTLVVKLPQEQVAQLIAQGVGEPFAPAGRTFREWVALPAPDQPLWQRLLDEARAFATTPTTC